MQKIANSGHTVANLNSYRSNPKMSKTKCTDFIQLIAEHLAAAATTTSTTTTTTTTATDSRSAQWTSGRSSEVRDEADRDVRDEAGAEEDNDDGDGEQPAKL